MAVAIAGKMCVELMFLVKRKQVVLSTCKKNREDKIYFKKLKILKPDLPVIPHFSGDLYLIVNSPKVA